MIPHTHPDNNTFCTLCGVTFPHTHPDDTKPKEFTMTMMSSNGTDISSIIQLIESMIEANERMRRDLQLAEHERSKGWTEGLEAVIERLKRL